MPAGRAVGQEQRHAAVKLQALGRGALQRVKPRHLQGGKVVFDPVITEDVPAIINDRVLPVLQDVIVHMAAAVARFIRLKHDAHLVVIAVQEIARQVGAGAAVARPAGHDLLRTHVVVPVLPVHLGNAVAVGIRDARGQHVHQHVRRRADRRLNRFRLSPHQRMRLVRREGRAAQHLADFILADVFGLNMAVAPGVVFLRRHAPGIVRIIAVERGKGAEAVFRIG